MRGCVLALEGEQHERGRARDRLGDLAEDAAIAVVDAAGVHGAIEQHGDAFLDARMVALARRGAVPGTPRTVGSTQEKLFSAHGQPMSWRSMS